MFAHLFELFEVLSPEGPKNYVLRLLFGSHTSNIVLP